MHIPIILVYTSIILWIIPIFKQYKTEYFLFFLILAISDPLIMLFYLFIHFNAQTFTWVVILFLITSLTTKKRKRQTLLVVSLIAMTISLLFKMDITVMTFISCLLHLIILGIIIVNLLNRFLITQSLNLFLCLLIVYESINIMKCLVFLSSNNTGIFSWYVGVVTQFIFALLFTFININTKEIHFIPKN
jgi:hypothetical protein